MWILQGSNSNVRSRRCRFQRDRYSQYFGWRNNAWGTKRIFRLANFSTGIFITQTLSIQLLRLFYGEGFHFTFLQSFQVYLQGEFFAGCDIMYEMYQKDELRKELLDAQMTLPDLKEEWLSTSYHWFSVFSAYILYQNRNSVKIFSIFNHFRYESDQSKFNSTSGHIFASKTNPWSQQMCFIYEWNFGKTRGTVKPHWSHLRRAMRDGTRKISRNNFSAVLLELWSVFWKLKTSIFEKLML